MTSGLVLENIDRTRHFKNNPFFPGRAQIKALKLNRDRNSGRIPMEFQFNCNLKFEMHPEESVGWNSTKALPLQDLVGDVIQ